MDLFVRWRVFRKGDKSRERLYLLLLRFIGKWTIVGIPMGTNCAPLVADLFLFCYEKDFMTALSDA